MKQKFISKIVKSIKKITGPGAHQLHEPLFKKFVKTNNAIAVVNGTQAIFVSLKVLGVKPNDEILVPALTFVGTVNAISYTGATPHFIDSSISNFGIDTEKLDNYLKSVLIKRKGKYYNKKTKKRIKAIIPVHIFGHACEIESIIRIAKKYNLKVIEDAAEAVGSYYKKKHLGTFGDIGCFSFNGNKIITTGGGGMIVLRNKTSIFTRS